MNNKMKSMLFAGAMGIIPLLAGCAEPTLGVAVSAINYTEQDLNGFLFVNPDNERKVAGGPGLVAYGAGGTMCCYALPKRWRPGIKVKLIWDWWEGSADIRNRKSIIIEVPRYPDNEAGMLWALFYPDGSVEVVSSDFGPGHEKWPGKIKSWPVPSLEHQRKLWEQERDEKQDRVNYFRQCLKEIDTIDLSKDWESDTTYNMDAVRNFFGPTDPAYREFSKKRCQNALTRNEYWLDQLEQGKP